LHACRSTLEDPLFKASYFKANRSSIHSFTGIGNAKALKILSEVKKIWGIPIITDVHSEHEVGLAAEVVDALQIPAFLCRQTSLLKAAGASGKIVNIKKGQFLAPQMMALAAEKVRSTGNSFIMLTERGTMFGYHDLIVDFRSVPIMRQTGYPVVVDCTHALQQPNQGTTTGGQPQWVETIAKCAIASGADGIFIETHPSPEKALSDGANMIALRDVSDLLTKLIRLRSSL
jgi:3-deoxy-D-manno-octulosonic acid (KDO) 8-phosphate synthase